MGILFFFMLFGLIIVVMLVSLLVRLVLYVWGVRKKITAPKHNVSSSRAQRPTGKGREKIIPHDEGEYVDFEDVD